ncbi:hypothetical protein KKI19_03870 [Patescibacteria group bacterium]|nr:hypothetical protein [Patescibacteria group bacterium]
MTIKARKKRSRALKFYIASSFSEKEKIRKLMDKIEKKGHKIAFDWTTHQSIKPYEKKIKLAAKYAKEDIEGVKDCDIFVMVPSKEGGSTQFAELGVAIVMERVKRIFVVGPYNNRSMSFFHPKVERINSIEEIFTKLFH